MQSRIIHQHRIGTWWLCRRDACLRAQGFEDPFQEVKREEDAKALVLLPTVLRCCSSFITGAAPGAGTQQFDVISADRMSHKRLQLEVYRFLEYSFSDSVL